MVKKITTTCSLMLIGLALVASLHGIERSNAQVIARDETALGEFSNTTVSSSGYLGYLDKGTPNGLHLIGKAGEFQQFPLRSTHY